MVTARTAAEKQRTIAFMAAIAADDIAARSGGPVHYDVLTYLDEFTDADLGILVILVGRWLLSELVGRIQREEGVPREEARALVRAELERLSVMYATAREELEHEARILAALDPEEQDAKA